MTINEIAIFAAGCFWCTEPVFKQLKGVVKVESGYIGGHTADPTYESICNGDTGHAEAIKISFDANEVSFESLLEIFFMSHEPTTINRQGNDIGTQYRSAVFCQNIAQTQSVEKIIAALNASNMFRNPIVTEINGAEKFYIAEEYHQNYFSKNPDQPYCLAVAAPKAAKIREKYPLQIKK